ncbi:MAG: site-specific integrase [Clostridiales bacterium]|nr:site-specific integrase [Clostridiales bacterium]
MASVIRKERKDGSPYYELRFSQGRGSTLVRRYTPPEGLSRKNQDRAAEKEWYRLEEEVRAGKIVTKKQKAAQEAAEAAERAKLLTVEEYAEKVFLPAKRVNRAEKTAYTYKWTFDKYINPAFGSCKLTEITSAQLTAFLLNFQATGAAHASVDRLHAILSTFFKMAYMDESIDRNPMDRVPKPEPRKDELQRQGPEAYTEQEEVYILQCLEREPLKWKCYTSILCETGCRRGEGLAVRWQDIDFSNLVMDINGSIGYTPEAGVYRSTPKSGKSRIVDISPGLAELLRQLRAEQSERCISEYVFTQDGTPNPMHPDSPNRYLRSFGKRYGIKNLHPHKLRHSYASIAITNGADVVSVSEILGHADTAITLRTYSHANEESRKRANNIFREALKEAAK